ncbi:hypothetical protein HY490_01225 [Candidatus Woesearchaeota archaeon]|nr:hypothetical protein [Candidatus Woesearchaeota archaeon]
MDELELQRQQQGLQQRSQEEFAMQQQLAQVETMIKNIMTPEARSRFTNIKLASPDRAMQTLIVLAQLAQAGKVAHVDDTFLKQVLTQLNQPKQTRITRK